MQAKILLTGSRGLVGRALANSLVADGFQISELDLHATEVGSGDLRDRSAVARAIRSCDGVVHLGAVSRVLWGERDPDGCWSTNVGGTRTVLEAALASRRRPWVIVASSREVYGQAPRLPVAETTVLDPVNVYGRSKLAAERLVTVAREAGLNAAVVRLSNVYGCPLDHEDRVVPAFARGAALGERLRVDGRSHCFDFTHLDDTIAGLRALIDRMLLGDEAPPPIHLLTGRPTTLGELAELAIGLAQTRASIEDAPPRSYDVARFYGDPARAKLELGWTPKVELRNGLARLIADFRAVS